MVHEPSGSFATNISRWIVLGFRSSIGGGPSALAVSYDRHLGLAQPSTRRCLPDFESPMLPATRLALALREKIAVLGL